MLLQFGRVLLQIVAPISRAEEAHGWASLVWQLLVLVGLGTGAASFLIPSPLPIIIYVLIVLIMLTFAAAYRLQGKVDEIEQKPAPCLIFGQPRVRQVWIGPVESVHSAAAINTAIEVHSLTRTPDLKLREGISFKGEPFSGITQVANDPENSSSEAQANHVVIKLTFFDVDGREAVNLDGRWTDNEQPGTRPHLMPIDDIRRRDLIPNGEPNHIDIALKYEEDDSCYAFNDETCRHSPDWRDPAYKMPDSEYRVRIVLKGVGLKPTEDWLLLKNHGKGKGMSLERTTPLVPCREVPQPQ